MMDIETVKNYLAMYDETYSWIQLSNMTGYSIDRLRELYDEIFENKEIQSRRKAMRRMEKMHGVFQIDPVSFMHWKYTQLSQLKERGFNVSNVFYACRNPASLCNGFLWRFGVDVDEHHIEASLREANPELFVPVKSINLKTGEKNWFNTLQIAHSKGFNKKCIMEVINGKKKSYKGCTWVVW